jgi:glycerate kinase
MKIVVAIDSFKGSLSSAEAGRAVKEAAESVFRSPSVSVFPLADGGEGTVDALSEGGERISVLVSGPLGEEITAEYCITRDKTAVIEMASAAGLPLVPESLRNPMETTSFGVGQMIKDAISRGYRKFIIGIGGSATNDGGVGMLTALGYEFLDGDGNSIPLGAKGLSVLKNISAKNVLPQLSECSFRIACDVKNPLCGKNGCSAVFGPQKGASPEEIEKMDRWLSHYATLSKSVSERADPLAPGSGAAGGIGFAFLSFTNATLSSGIQIVLEEIGIEESIKNADLVITGEGRLDAQTVMGKAPSGVASLAKKYGKKLIAFSGCVTKDAELCNENGIDAFFPILRSVTSANEALDKSNAYENLLATAKQVFRLIRAFSDH